MDLSDLRYACRLLGRSRTFTVAVLLLLALGIGATTAVFAVARTVLWRSLPYADPGRLVVVWESDARHAFANRNEASSGNFLAWRDRTQSFERLAALAYRTPTLTGEGEPERLQAAAPSVDFFDMLGVRPALGRTFSAAEEQPTAAPTAVLSHGLWVRRFGAEPGVVGRTILLSGVPTTVIGVLPPGFSFEFPTRRQIDVWVPRVVTPEARQAHRGRGLYVVGRLKAGVPIGRARAEMATIASSLEREHPRENGGWSVTLVPLDEQIVGASRASLVVLLAAGGCLLLIVCATISTLLLTRVSARRAELATRSALGATGGRLFRQLLSESLVLGVGGLAAGLLLGWFAIVAVRHNAPALDLPRLGELTLDPVIALFTVAAGIGCSVASGLVPARRALAGRLVASMRDDGMRGTAGNAAPHALLVSAEVALAVMLVIVSTLLFTSLARLGRVDPGFDPDGVLTFQLSLPSRTYADEAAIASFYDRLLEGLRGTAGVAAAGAVTNLPLEGTNQTRSFNIDGRPAEARPPEADFRAVTPGYLDAMRMRLRAGRFFDRRDVGPAAPVAVINDSTARRWWPGVNAIGRRLRFGGADAPWVTIVGVVDDVRHAGLGRAPAPEVYVPQAQEPSAYMYIVVRSALPPATLARTLAARVHEVDRNVPLYRVEPLSDIVAGSVAKPRADAALVGAFSLAALLLALAGTYGVVAYATTRRTREIGVRLALGAQRADVVRLLLVGGVRTTVAGAAAGTLAALAAAGLVESLLFGVSARDPVTFVGVPVVLASTALVACVVPAWRASRLDPVSVLRAE